MRQTDANLPITTESVTADTDKKPRRAARKKLFSGLPLHYKLIAYFLLFSLVMLVILWLSQIVFLDEFYRMIKTDRINDCAQSLAQNINNDDFGQLVDDIYEQNDIDVQVYNTNISNIFVMVQSSGTKRSLNVIHDYYASAKQNGGSVLVYEQEHPVHGVGEDSFGDRFEGAFPGFDRERAKTLTRALIVESQSGDEYMIVLSSLITPVGSTVETLRYQLIVITAVLVVFSVVLATVVSRKIARPLAKTNESAKRLACQDYDVSFSAGGYREITELNATLSFAAQELNKVDELRRELIANISHDLRTPLTMISGYAEVMRDIPGENTRENLQIVIDESNHLSALVSDLLDISRLQSGAVALQKEEMSLTESIRRILQRYSKLVGKEGYVIDFEYSEEVTVLADELRLSQVLYNLINNAVNYSGEDKTVIVRQTVTGGTVRVEVTDHGSGIDAEHLKYIWDRYYKVDREHKQAVIGTGLGLSIVKNILDLHGSHYGVSSTPGKGSTFWFELEAPSTRARQK